MDRQQAHLIEQRSRGQRLLHWLTGGVAALAVGLSGLFGLTLLHHDRATAAPANPVPDQSYRPEPRNTGRSGGGSVIQPPAQPPRHHNGGGGSVPSGGS